MNSLKSDTNISLYFIVDVYIREAETVYNRNIDIERSTKDIIHPYTIIFWANNPFPNNLSAILPYNLRKALCAPFPHSYP